MKIRFVQLERGAFLTDIDFIQMSPAERGVCGSLFFFPTPGGAKCRFDTVALCGLTTRENKAVKLLYEWSRNCR